MTTTKKTTTTARRAAAKTAVDAASTNEIPAPATVTKPKRAKAPKAIAPKKAAAAKKSVRKRTVAAAKAGFTQQDIALQAYFIAEKRQQRGEHGTPESDWLEAERLLRTGVAT